METLDVDEVYAIYRHSRGSYGLVENTIFLNEEEAEKRAEELNKANPKLECKAVILGEFISDFAQYRHDMGFRSAMQRVEKDSEENP